MCLCNCNLVFFAPPPPNENIRNKDYTSSPPPTKKVIKCSNIDITKAYTPLYALF